MTTPCHAVAPGSLVRHASGLALKAERDGKDYINHYLIPLTPSPHITLIYVDPETSLDLVEGALSLDLGEALAEGSPAETGDILVFDQGTFLKVWDVKKDGQRHLAYVDLVTGLVGPRLERGARPRMFRCHRFWRVSL
jgi:hypothetical protein